MRKTSFDGMVAVGKDEKMRRSRHLLVHLAVVVAAGCGGSSSTGDDGTDGGGANDGNVDVRADDARDVDSASSVDGSVDALTDATTDALGDVGDVGDVASGCVLVDDVTRPTSDWAKPVGHELTYATTPKGDRLLDFSTAGYMGGGVALPSVPMKVTLKPSGGDDSAAINGALADVAKLPLDKGVRGAVVLGPGTFKVSATLNLAASGVVLRGSGAGAGGTTLVLDGSPRAAISVSGTGAWSIKGSTSATISDAYVPSGARSFHVDSASGLAVGDTVLVDRPVTAAWIHFMGMDALVRDGKPQTWLSDTTIIHSDRVITAIAGNLVTVDASLSDSLDAKYVSPPGVKVTKYTFAGRLEQVGVESLHLVAPKQTVPIDQPTFTAITMDAAQNGWIRDVSLEEFTSGIVLSDGAKWITVQDVKIARTAPIDNGAGYPFQISVAGQQTLVQRIDNSGDDAFPYAIQARTPGPNVLLGLVSAAKHSPVQPHQRWGTGLLVDSVKAEEIDLMSRGYFGTGHGWTMGFGVIWNGVVTSGMLVQAPPGAQNWAIGPIGTLTKSAAPGSSDPTPLPQGIIDSAGKPVAPKSLYLAQLCVRLGPSALKNIGY